MIHNKHFIRSLALGFIASCSIACAPTRLQKNAIPTPRVALSSLNYQSASVLPCYHYKGQEWVILLREASGKDKGTYDDAGGGRDKGGKGKPKREEHPVLTATREFWEEAILEKTIGLDLPQTKTFVEKNSSHIICYSNTRGVSNVTYIINFDIYKDMFFKNFYHARNKATKFKFREKDIIAVLPLKSLKNAIVNNANSFKTRWFGNLFSQTVTVSALELDPKTLRFKTSTITLRPFLVKKLQSFFLAKPYKRGKSKKIRFYKD